MKIFHARLLKGHKRSAPRRSANAGFYPKAKIRIGVNERQESFTEIPMKHAAGPDFRIFRHEILFVIAGGGFLRH